MRQGRGGSRRDQRAAWGVAGAAEGIIIRVNAMVYKVLVHKAEEGGFWAEVPKLPRSAADGATAETKLEP